MEMWEDEPEAESLSSKPVPLDNMDTSHPNLHL